MGSVQRGIGAGRILWRWLLTFNSKWPEAAKHWMPSKLNKHYTDPKGLGAALPKATTGRRERAWLQLAALTPPPAWPHRHRALTSPTHHGWETPVPVVPTQQTLELGRPHPKFILIVTALTSPWAWRGSCWTRFPQGLNWRRATLQMKSFYRAKQY